MVGVEVRVNEALFGCVTFSRIDYWSDKGDGEGSVMILFFERRGEGT